MLSSQLKQNCIMWRKTEVIVERYCKVHLYLHLFGQSWEYLKKYIYLASIDHEILKKKNLTSFLERILQCKLDKKHSLFLFWNKRKEEKKLYKKII